MTRVRKIRDGVLAFHRDERGESSTMSNVMMLAIAAIVVVALIAFGNIFLKWLNEKKDDIMQDGNKMGEAIKE